MQLICFPCTYAQVAVLVIAWCVSCGCLQATPLQHLRNTGSHVRKLLSLLVTTIGIVVGIIFTTTVIVTVSVVLVLVTVTTIIIIIIVIIVIVTNIVCLYAGSLSQLDVARFAKKYPAVMTALLRSLLEVTVKYYKALLG